MQVLILGCNQLTTNLAPGLAQDNHQVTVLSQDRICLERVADEAGVSVILTSEPMMQDYLQQGGIDTAGVFLSLTANDHQNALAAQIAQHIYNVPKVICHLNDPQLQIFYSGLGLEVIGYSFGLLQDIRQVMDR